MIFFLCAAYAVLGAGGATGRGSAQGARVVSQARLAGVGGRSGAARARARAGHVALFAAAGLLLALTPIDPAAAQTARDLFSAKGAPTSHAPHAIGRHGLGCLAGGVQLPETGPTWQAMRLARNHHWGHPAAMAFVERLSRQAVQAGWRGLYVGDISQARGGPIPGHASHQIGLDIDIWMLPPQRLDLSRAERERISSISVRSADGRRVNGNWTRAHHAIMEAAARDPEVERIFVTGPVKMQMCADAGPRDRDWLAKIRPWWGHDTHFHVRLRCPAGQPGCTPPDPLPAGDGCAEAVWWVTEALEPPDPAAPPPAPRPQVQLADLPEQCRTVLAAP